MSDEQPDTRKGADSAREAAVLWFVRVEAGTLDDIERQRFREWLRADPLNRIEYDKLDLIWHMAPSAEDLAVIESFARRVPGCNWRMTDAWRDAVCPSALTSPMDSVVSQTTSPMMFLFGAAVPALFF